MTVWLAQWRLLLGLVLLGALAGGSAWGGWKWRDMRAAQQDAQRLEAAAEIERERAHQAAAAAGGHEADKTRLRTEFVTITETVSHVIEKPVYRNVCLDADGLRALSQAVGAGTAAPGEPAHPVP